jgi:hypothetical protein
MAQSLIPFPSTNHPNVPISRRWIAFREGHPQGWRPVLGSRGHREKGTENSGI